MGLDTVQDRYGVDSPSAFSHHNEAVFNTTGATPVSGFKDEVDTLEASDISFFGHADYPCLGQSDDWKETGIRNFDSLVSNRFSYLAGLRNLGTNWISGGGIKPSSSAIFLSQALLSYIRKKVISEEVSLIPRIVMGPIPSGGILVELHADDDNAINVTISNDDRVELEVQYDGYYYEFNLAGNELIGTVTSQYASISR